MPPPLVIEKPLPDNAVCQLNVPEDVEVLVTVIVCVDDCPVATVPKLSELGVTEIPPTDDFCPVPLRFIGIGVVVFVAL